jgi:hypothetical protein
MSVMACSRHECSHILCDKLILDGSMYICSTCWEELLLYKNTWPAIMKAKEVKERIEQFMNNSIPGEFLLVNQEEIDTIFNYLTKY